MAMPFPIFFSAEGNPDSRIRGTAHSSPSFVDLFSGEGKKLYNFILKSLNYSEDADDIFQETVLRAYRYFGNFDHSRSFAPWLFTIASNEVRRYFRNRANPDLAFPLDRLPAIEENGGDRELIDAVFTAAFGLKAAEREIFFLFYDSGFSVREISEITGKQNGNIKVILSNARKKIRELLGSNK